MLFNLFLGRWYWFVGLNVCLPLSLGRYGETWVCDRNSIVLAKRIGLTSFNMRFTIGQLIKPQSVVRPLTCCFRLFPSLPVHLLFACRHLTCLILLTYPATSSRIRKTICPTTHKICTGSNDRFGLKQRGMKGWMCEKVKDWSSEKIAASFTLACCSDGLIPFSFFGVPLHFVSELPVFMSKHEGVSSQLDYS